MNNKRQEPKVSCLVITYNQEDFIRETLDSILQQDYINFEIIVSDDGSTDKTQEILETYKKNNPDIITILTQQENVGITKNTNRALAKCSGQYLALIGGDDVWLPGKLSKQIQWFQKNDDASVCYHDVVAFDSKTKRELYFFKNHHRQLVGGIADALNGDCFAAASSVMIDIGCVPDLKFDEGLPHVSDWFFVLEVLIKTNKKIGYIDGLYSKYRKHSHNITQLKDLKFEFLEGYEILSKRYPKYQKELNNGYSICYSVILLNMLKNFKFISAIKMLLKRSVNYFILVKCCAKRILRI